MLPRLLLVIVSLVFVVSAAPSRTVKSQIVKREASANTYAYTSELAAFYAAISKEIKNIKGTAQYDDGDSCDMSKAAASFPSAPTPLPSPDSGASLQHVVLGMGTQVSLHQLLLSSDHSY